MPFLLLFSIPLAVALTTMSNMRRETGLPSLHPDFTENALNFSLFTIILTVCLSHIGFIIALYSL